MHGESFSLPVFYFSAFISLSRGFELLLSFFIQCQCPNILCKQAYKPAADINLTEMLLSAKQVTLIQSFSTGELLLLLLSSRDLLFLGFQGCEER